MENETPKGLPRGGEPLTAEGLLKLVGGWLGIAESVAPPMLFSAVFTLTSSGLWAVVSASVLATFFLAFRTVRRQKASGALIGLLGIGLAAFLALREGGQTLDYFVPGFFTNAGYGLVIMISILVRRPILGYVLGFLAGNNTWRQDNKLRRMAIVLSLIWVGFFAIRLAVQVPLYLAGNLQLLAASRALLGAPAYAALLGLSWVFIRGVVPKSNPV